MSEENNNLGDDIKKGAEEAAETVKDTAKEFTEGAKEILGSQENKKVLAGVLGIVFGYLGVHKFVLGYNMEGIILLSIFLVGLVLSCFVIGYLFVWIPGVIGFIEGIIYLTKSDEEFYQTYQVGKKSWF